MRRKTTSDNVLRDKSFNNPKTPKYDEYKRARASKVHLFFDKKSSCGAIKSKITLNQNLAEELYKPIFRKSEK